jgi:ribA/ribD-fused uncharacterized protein
MAEIKGFQGQYRFLSNFYPCEIWWEGYCYKSSEAAYQASKTADLTIKERMEKLNARDARTLGQDKTQTILIPGWDTLKLNVMYRILRIKFAKDPLRGQLESTYTSYLEETNYWRDDFWGVYNGKGENHLGRLLMLVRDEIKEGII